MAQNEIWFPLTVTERLNFQAIPSWILQIARTLSSRDFQVFLVGGAVRDLLRGHLPTDWDLTTDALPEQVEEVFPRTRPTGKPFGTITVLWDDHPVEITTFREDLGRLDGRHPEAVRFSSDILKDLARRDFTINAMAYHFVNQKLLDPFAGRRDLYRNSLRTVGDPRVRFQEDALRMFRLIRFLATLGFRPHPSALRAIEPAYAHSLSAERIRDELTKILTGKWVRNALNALADSGLLERFLPELMVRQFKAGSFNRNLWDHLIAATEAIRADPTLRWAALLHDIAKPLTFTRDAAGIHFHGHADQGAVMSRAILNRLHYPKKFIERVVYLIGRHMFALSCHASDASLCKFIAKVDMAQLPDLLELRRADMVATGRISRASWEDWNLLNQRLDALCQNESLAVLKPLAVNGHDLMAALKLSPGPLIGEILDDLAQQVMDDPDLNQRPILLKLAGDYLKTGDFDPS